LEPADGVTTLAVDAFLRFIVTAGRLWAVEDPKSTAAAGGGTFSLFRRSVLDRTPGLEWLKMEVGDDVGLGVMLKRLGGARQRAVVARETVSLQIYPSFRALTRALEKNGASAPMLPMLLGLFGLTALEVGWLAGFAAWWPLGVSAWVLCAVVSYSVSRWLRCPTWPALLPGLGFLPLAAVLARSTVLAWVRGGVMWRGCFYPTSAVRAGRRLP
jgi:hypothetical protein